MADLAVSRTGSFATPGVLYKVLADTNAVQLTTTTTPFKVACFIPCKADGTANTGGTVLRLGPGSSNQPIVIAASLTPAGYFWLTAPEGQVYDLSTWYIKGTAADGVAVVYS